MLPILGSGWHVLKSEALEPIALGSSTPFNGAPAGTEVVHLTFSGGDLYYTLDDADATVNVAAAHKIPSTAGNWYFSFDVMQIRRLKMIQSAATTGYVTYWGAKR